MKAMELSTRAKVGPKLVPVMAERAASRLPPMATIVLQRSVLGVTVWLVVLVQLLLPGAVTTSYASIKGSAMMPVSLLSVPCGGGRKV